MNNQKILLKQIRKRLTDNQSINEEIAGVLNISYDAAHRRVSGKSKFSIDDTVELAKYYNISMDSLFANNEQVIVKKTIEIQSLEDMLQYFKNSAEMIEKLTSKSGAMLYYSAKDIPLFYFMDGTLLSKFKAFVWLKLSNTIVYDESFEVFVVNQQFMKSMQKLKKAHQNTKIIEIWNDSTINSSLQQIQYFYEAGLVNFITAKALFEDLKRILSKLKSRINDSNNLLSIYYNELILPNNNLLFENEGKSTLFVPYTLLGYFITDDFESCANVKQYFEQQISNSKPLNLLGIKEQNLFFNKANRKIDFYLQQLNNQVNFEF